MKPLFIPLKTEHYEAFATGEKSTELRIYGPRWNEDTCRIGRSVILSKGYGKKNRLIGMISDFGTIPAEYLDEKDRAAVKDCYGTTHVDIAVISIEDLKPATIGEG